MMQQMMSNPMMQQMMQQVMSNPAMMELMMASNPMAQQMMAANPQVAEMLRNPALMQQMMDPANLQAMMQLQQSMAQLQSTGLMPAIPGMPAMPGAAGAGTQRPAGTPGAAGPAGFDMGSLLSALAPPTAAGGTGQHAAAGKHFWGRSRLAVTVASRLCVCSSRCRHLLNGVCVRGVRSQRHRKSGTEYSCKSCRRWASLMRRPT